MSAEAQNERRRTAGRPEFYKLFMHYVYLSQSVKHPQRKYIGKTEYLKQRFETHNSGGSVHTKLHRPWKLILVVGFDNKFKATAFEKYLKSGAGRAFAKKRFW